MDALVEVDASVAATGAYELTVSFAGTVDEDAASFAVKRGLTSVTVDDIDWNSDSTEATLTLASKIKEGTYYVTVSDVAAEDIDLSVETEDEAVAAINWLSDNMVASDEDLMEATATYEVLNQYGEDVTEDSIAGSLELASRFDDDDVTIDDGIITFDLTQGDTTATEGDFDLGDTFNCTLIDDESAVTAATTLTLVDTATAEEITIGEVWNEDDLELNTDNSAYEFYLLLDLTDQYGNSILSEDTANSDLKVKTNDTDIISIPTYSSTSNAQVELIDVDDEDVLAIPLTLEGDDGDVTITVISKGSGATASVDLTVEPGLVIDTVSIGTPDVTIAGAMTVDIPVDVTDNAGEEVTEINDLFDNADLTLDVEQDGKDDTDGLVYDWTEEDGQIYVTVTTLSVATDDVETLRVEVNTPTDEYSYKTYKVYEDAVPESIVELSSDVSRTLLIDTNTEIDYEDFVVEDQYGNVMDSTDYIITTDGATNFDVVSADGSDPIILNANGDSSSATLTFSLWDDTETAFTTDEYDTLNVKFSATSATSFASYTVEDFGTIYTSEANDAYAVPVQVYGVTTGGKSVLLPNSYYTVNVNSNYLGKATNASDSTVTMLYGMDTTLYDTNTSYPTSRDVTATIIINATGDTLTSSGTIDCTDPEVVSITTVKDNYTDLQSDTLTTVTSYNNSTSGAAIDMVALLANSTYGTGTTPIQYVATDSYGVLADLDTANTEFTNGSYTFDATITYGLVTDGVVFTNNGTSAATVSSYSANDYFYATLVADGVSSNAARVKATGSYTDSSVIGVTGTTTLVTDGVDASAAVAATGTITYGAPVDGDTVTVAGTTFTYNSVSGTADFSTIAELTTAIDGLSTVGATNDGTDITVTATTAGAAGNSIAMSLGTNTGTMTISDTTLLGGVDAVEVTTVTVAGTTFTYNSVSGTADFSTIAELTTAIDGLSTVGATNDGTDITVTATTAGAAGNSIAMSVAGDDTTTTVDATLTGGTDATAAVTAVTEVSKLTINTGASAAGTITVTVDGTAHTVTVASGDSKNTVAAAIQTKLASDGVTGYTVTVSSNVITFTGTTAGAMTDLTATIS